MLMLLGSYAHAPILRWLPSSSCGTLRCMWCVNNWVWPSSVNSICAWPQSLTLFLERLLVEKVCYLCVCIGCDYTADHGAIIYMLIRCFFLVRMGLYIQLLQPKKGHWPSAAMVRWHTLTECCTSCCTGVLCSYRYLLCSFIIILFIFLAICCCSVIFSPGKLW